MISDKVFINDVAYICNVNSIVLVFNLVKEFKKNRITREQALNVIQISLGCALYEAQTFFDYLADVE